MDRRTSKIMKKSKRREDFKVVYISSPVKVKTCASKFKTLVQELTGRHSDLSRFVETNNDDDVDDHKQYLSVVDLAAAGAGDEIDHSSTTSRASSESNYNFHMLQMMDEQSRQMMTCYHDDQMFDGLLSSPFEATHSKLDVVVDRTENYYYIPTF